MVYLIIFITGGIGYSIMEILWRGYTHWTMAIAGGLSFLAIYIINNFYGEFLMFWRCLLGCAVITLVELVFGVVFNLLLKWNVWDYSNMIFNIKGQICLFYSLAWFGLCYILFPLCDFFDEIIFEKII